MKSFLLFSLVLGVLILTPLQGNERNFLKPDSTYKNETKETVYLILELPPEKEFKNKSKYLFDIVRPHELLEYTFEIRHQIKIDSLIAILNLRKSKLDSLEKKYEELEK